MSATFSFANPLVLFSALLGLVSLASLFAARVFWHNQARSLHTLARDTAIEHMDEGLIILDPAGRIVEYNSAAARLARLDRAARGQMLAAAPGDRALAALLESMRVSAKGTRTIALQAPQPRRLQITLTPLADANSRPRGALVRVRDCSDQMQSEAALAQQLARLDALSQLHSAGSPAQLQLRTIADVACTALGVEHASIGLIDEARGQLAIAAESASAESSLLGMSILLNDSAYAPAWPANAPTLSDDAHEQHWLALAHTLVEQGPAHTLLIAPLRANGRLLGTLNLAGGAARELAPMELALAQMLADYTAAMIATMQLASAAQQADRAKSAILDTISHEFRTPLTSILGFTELYQEQVLGSVSEEQQEALDAIYRNAQRLLKLVDDLLDLARIEAGKLDMSLYPVEVELCIKEAVGLLAAQFEQKQLDLQLEIAGELPLAWADAMWLRRVLVNLLANALRYTTTGAITVRAYEASAHKSPRRMVIEIEDTGRGIPPAEQALIFDAFQRASGAQSTFPTSSGAGLGLTISKRAIDQMDGQLALQSLPDHGSIFTIMLHTAELELEHPRR